MNGGAHLSDTAKYQLPKTQPAFNAQGGWKRCAKCGSLFFGGNTSPTRCPAVLPHDGTGSPDYHLAHQEGPGSLANLSTPWRTCSKCRTVYFSGHPGAACAAGQAGNEKPFYDMGGTDGQLVKVDRANDRVYPCWCTRAAFAWRRRV